MSTPKSQGTSGWIIFASTLLVLGSISQFATGLTMVFNSEWVQFNTDSAIVDIKIHGWISLAVGVLMIAAAWGIIGAKTWARVVGVLFGAATVLNGILMIPTYVILGLVITAFGIMVIYALTVRGKDVSSVPQASLDEGGTVARTFRQMDDQADERPEQSEF